MFTRQAFRAAFPLRNNIRHYATEAPKSGPNVALYGGIAAAAGVGAYYFMNRPVSADAPRSSEEAKAIPPQSEASLAFKGGDQGFISLKLDEVEVVNHNTKKFRFALPEENSLPGLNITSAVLAKYKGPEMEKPVIRPYTPISAENTRGFIEFIVKVYPNGPMSEHFHSMNPGQRLDFKGPIPKYPWSPNKHERIALLAGGTGITPMFQLARAIFSNPEDKTQVTLVFGNISEEDILLKREWEDLENEFPNRFRAFYVLEKPPKEWAGGKGYITKELLKTVLPDPKLGDKIKVFVCGPPPMYNALSGNKKSPTDQGELTGALKELGYTKDQVYKF